MGLTAVFTLLIGMARADVFTWTGTGGDAEWRNANNWENQALPTGTSAGITCEIIISDVENLPSVITGTFNYTSFTYNGTQDLTISTLAATNNSPSNLGVIYNNSGHNLTIANERTLGAGFGVRSGMVTLTGTVSDYVGNISVVADGDSTDNIVAIVNGYAVANYGRLSAGGGNTLVNHTSTIAGTGTVRGGAGVVLVNPDSGGEQKPGGILAPGDPNANDGIGKLTVSGSLIINGANTMDSGGRLEMQLNNLSSYDQLDVTGNMNINSGHSDRYSRLNLIFDPNTIELGAYYLFTYGSGASGGVLSGFGTDISSESPNWSGNLRWYTGVEANLGTLEDLGYTWSLSNVLNDILDPTLGGIIRFEIIPEPSTVALLGIGILTLALLRRKRGS
jgi:hypothetical protein